MFLTGGGTFGSVLDARKGVGPGFDALRIGLSISILCFHAPSIVGDSADPAHGPAGYVAALFVPAFFALSGFLVIASAVRVNSLATFLTFRGLRILPALFTEVLITALIVGPLATTLTWSVYFSHPEFFAYFLNLIGNVHFILPGVFSDNPMKAVNASLWTIRPEIVCYVALALVLLGGFHRSLTFYLFLTGALLAIMATLSLAQSTGPWGMTFAAQAKYFFYFIVGNLAYHLRHHIPFHPAVLAMAALLGILLIQYPGWEVLAAFPVVYCIVFLGLVPLPILTIFARGDYSYGVYLFAYPIQQLVASFEWTRTWYLNIMLSLPLTFIAAAVSWHWVEKPFLGLKSKIKIPDHIESTILSYFAIRFVTAFCLVCYGIAVSAWAGLYFALGARLRDNIVSSLLFATAAALVISAAAKQRETLLRPHDARRPTTDPSSQ